MTRSGATVVISSVVVVQESWRMGRLRVASSGRASRQYFVWAQRVSSALSEARVRVMEGWRLAMRRVFRAI